MAASATFSSEDRVGIGAALVAHVALAAGLMWLAQQRDLDEQLPPPERIEVSLATEVSLESTAPDPSAEPAASMAPVITEVPQAPVETIPTPVEPRPQPTTNPAPRPTPTPRRPNTPTPSASPSPRSTPRVTPTPSPSASQRPGGSRLNDNFLGGRSNSTGESGSPAATWGPSAAADLRSAITRQLRRNWSAPQGVETEQLVTIVAWRLNRDGSVSGTPRCTSQSGITESNRPQASVHCDRAIRAVRLADFSGLPVEFYSRWDDLEWTFDRRL